MVDIKSLASNAVDADDLTQVKKFERELPKAGTALLRFRDYIELGKQKSNNPKYKPAINCILTFELSHPKHLIEIDGKKVPQKIDVRLNKGQTAKAQYRRLFNVMNDACGGGHKHFITMIGEAFLGEIFHKKSEKNGETYANLDKDGAYSLKAPQSIDPISEEVTPIPVRELEKEPKVFLWENEGVTDEQIKEMWDSIYIEGTRTVTREVDGEKVEVEVTKNFLQETITEAVDWEGSRTQGVVTEYPSLDEEEEDAEEQEESTDAGEVPVL